jgi:hypothetical protein
VTPGDLARRHAASVQLLAQVYFYRQSVAAKRAALANEEARLLETETAYEESKRTLDAAAVPYASEGSS